MNTYDGRTNKGFRSGAVHDGNLKLERLVNTSGQIFTMIFQNKKVTQVKKAESNLQLMSKFTQHQSCL